MIRHQLARILSAVADRIEHNQPAVEIQYEYVYVYSAPPVTITPTYPTYWQSPIISSPNTCVN
jgi:hypothetical protein